MTITIGRFGTDVTIGNPQNFARSGDRVKVTGWVQASTKAAMNALIQQLNGLTGPDEPVVPLTYSYDSTWDGYYTVVGVNHELDPNWEKTFKFQWSADLTRFASYPIVEMITYGANRTGNPGLTQLPWHSTADTWVGYDYGATTGATPTGTRALSASVNMNVYEKTAFNSATVTAGAAPAELYTGAATLKTGSTLYTVAGRATTNTPTAWELSNGLIKVGSSTGAGNSWTLSVRNKAGTAWSAAYGMLAGYSSAGPVWNTLASLRSVTVLRNSPEEVVIRLAYQVLTGNSGSVEVDLGLRRGARHCTVSFSSELTSTTWGLKWATAVACSYVSFYNVSIRETANNADGNRNFFGLVGATPTVDLANGIMYIFVGSGSAQGFFGSAPSGSTAAAIDAENNVEQEYYAAVSEKQRMAPQ